MADPLGNMISMGLGLASGNPLAIGAGAVGLGLSIFGGSEQASAARAKSGAEQQIAATEMKQDAVRRQAMELSARRQQMEVLRNAQRARSLALQNATTQGANQGSGLQGGYGQISGAANWNNAGISQNLSFGEQMFNLNNTINQQKMVIAQAGAQSATGAGIGALGKSLTGSFGPIKNLSSNFVGTGNSGGSGGSYGEWMSGMNTGGIV